MSMFDKTSFNVNETKTRIFSSKKYDIALTDESNQVHLELRVGHSKLLFHKDQVKDLYDMFKHYLVEKELVEGD